MDSRKLPPLNKARLAKRYQVGNYLFMEFFDIPDEPAISYVFALLVLDLKTEKPVLCVTSERTGAMVTEAFNKMMKGIGETLSASDAPFFCVTKGKDAIHSNLGSSEDWANQKKFFTEARRYACEELGLEIASSQVITKSSTHLEGDESKWMGIVAFLFFVGVCMAYCAYNSQESDEQKGFMLRCLGSHNEDFCDRLWDKRKAQS